MSKQPYRSVAYTARQLENHLTSPLTTLILMSATIGAVIYFIFLIQPQYRGDLLPYTLVLLAEFFIIVHGLISFWTILSGKANPRDFGFHHAQSGLFGVDTKTKVKSLERSDDLAAIRELRPRIHGKTVTVDVLIPSYGEPIEIIEQTAMAARDMYGAHQTYILDDGKSDEVALLAQDVGVRYIRRDHNTHAKAGNINHALSATRGDYFVVFDADFVAHPRFLYETLPFFGNDQVAFVQTPQYYSNQDNFVSTAASFMQHVFYSLVQSGKNKFNAAFCVGTNVIFRRSAIDAVGGGIRTVQVRGYLDFASFARTWLPFGVYQQGVGYRQNTGNDQGICQAAATMGYW
jgi:cellulose synthase (UDP-forming)